MKNLTLIVGLTIGILTTGFSQEYLREDIIKLNSISTDNKYGYTKKNPIKTGSIAKERHFLNALRGPNGEKVRYVRLGSCCEFKSKNAMFGKGLLDTYKVWYEGGQTVILYLNGYDYEDLKCPAGFTFVKSEEVQPVKTFADSLIKKTTVCNNSNVFSVDDHLLKEAVGEYEKPDKSPGYKEGIDELKQFFVQNPLTDKRAGNGVFRVKIGFMVNCVGEAGNYQIITKGKGDLKELANQVLEIVSNMPSNWNSAESGGKKVDCYQVLSFTVVQGSLEQVSYR